METKLIQLTYQSEINQLMAFHSASIVLLFTCLFLFTFSSSSASTTLSVTHKRINAICAQTQNPGFCITSLEGYLGGKKADVNELGIVSILLATAQARLNKYVVEQLVQTVVDPMTLLHLGKCEMDYDVTLEKLQDAYRLSDHKDYKGMFELVNDATTMTNECIDECMLLQNPPSSLKDDNQKMVWLNDIAFVILGMLNK